MISTKKWFGPFVHLFYPHICAGCGSDLLEKNQPICIHCYSQLPDTGFALMPGNPIEKIFYGRLDVEVASAGYYFTKNSVLQHLIHQLKYKGRKDVGFQLGEWLGLQLKKSKRFNQLDYIIPLPLFPDKEKKRGYNQAEIICNGISDILQVPVLNDVVIRKRHTETQTKKGRSERWINVEGSFEVKDPSILENNNILLVDDVITTGATIEACGYAIKNVPGTHLNIVSLAWAGHD